MTSIPASSVHSGRSGSTRGRPISVSDSPLATSSNASSEPSVNNNLMCFDSIDIDDELCSDRAGHYARWFASLLVQSSDSDEFSRPQNVKSGSVEDHLWWALFSYVGSLSVQCSFIYAMWAAPCPMLIHLCYREGSVFYMFFLRPVHCAGSEACPTGWTVLSFVVSQCKFGSCLFEVVYDFGVASYGSSSCWM